MPADFDGHDEDAFLADLPSDAFTSTPTSSPSKASPKVAAPCHHQLDDEALKTCIYPINVGQPRDYQYNIVAKALYQNVLVALPTGLGKTFIAATVMLNWFRWTKTAQIVFVAPTKPLVAQQIDACFHTVGIPRSETTMLTGGISPGLRAEEWSSKRVFFMTPQTIINDLKTGICDPKRIVLLVIDEAHRATGAYAYVEIVKFMRRFNQHFRVLALTATPGSSVETVQEVIDGLNISKTEIRTELSIDIRQYVHSRGMETVLFDYSEEMELIMNLFSKAVQPVLNKLTQFNAYWSRDPMQLTAFGLTQARRKWMMSPAAKTASMGVKGMINRIFSVLASLAHGVDLLKYHGIGPFYNSLTNFETTGGEGRYEKEIKENASFRKLMGTMKCWRGNPQFIGHPKLDYLQNIVLGHFLDDAENASANNGVSDARNNAPRAASTTRVMIFAHFRDSAEEIVRVLDRHRPTVRPQVFVGQAASKGSEGMGQKKQLEVIQHFKAGVHNTLVATSIGEEGLDIGEVDLIICYDSSASPIRMLQRMGRTGRKRAGNITLLLMRGKEEHSFAQAKDNYEKMQEMIAQGTRFIYHSSSRIILRHLKPAMTKKVVEIPAENSQFAGLPEPRTNGRKPKRPPKKFHMPDGVQTGFLSASSLQGAGRIATKKKSGGSGPLVRLEPVPEVEEVMLTPAEETILRKQYKGAYGGQSTVNHLDLTRHSSYQRKQTKECLIKHGRATRNFVRTLNAMHDVDAEKIAVWQSHLDNERETQSNDETELQVGTVDLHGSNEPSDSNEVGNTSGRDISLDPTSSGPGIIDVSDAVGKGGRTPYGPTGPKKRKRRIIDDSSD